jgi:hypothetical protein
MVMGCDFGQGALIAPPMSKESFLDLLRQRMHRPRGGTAADVTQAGAKPAGRVA